MDREFARLIKKHTPELNPVLANGVAVEHMKATEKYIHDVFSAAVKGLESIGLVYKGYARCKPQEEFDECTKPKTNKRYFDVARSDIYMVKYLFAWRDPATGQLVDLPPRFLYLPFVSDAGMITLGGSRFNISPILSDRVISVGVDNIFVRLLRDRLTFDRVSHHYLEDGKRQTPRVVWSQVYHLKKSQKPQRTVKAQTTLMHYLLCKYGFTEAFQRFGGCTPVVGGSEINHHTYPEDEWVVCSTAYTAMLKPKGVGKGYYQPSDLRVAVRRKELTPMVRQMIGGFFYVVDHFPQRVDLKYLDSLRMWRTLMGFILFGNGHEGTLHDQVVDHMSSLDEYLDVLVITKLREIGQEASDLYELFAKIMDKFFEWVNSGKDQVASMYNKELSVLYYVLFDITTAIFRLYFKLKAASKNKQLTDREIVATMNLTLRTGLIFSITKNHGEISTDGVPGDNKAFKITAKLVPQGSSSKLSSRKERAVISDPTKQLHASIAEVGGYSNLPKAEPSGRSRLNQHAKYDARNVITPNPKFAALLADVQEKISRAF